jgi:hypothetical protein
VLGWMPLTRRGGRQSRRILPSEDADFDPADPHQIPAHARWVFRRLNDAFTRDRVQHDLLLRGTAKPLPKEARELISKARKAYGAWRRTRDARAKASVVARVRQSLLPRGAEEEDAERATAGQATAAAGQTEDAGEASKLPALASAAPGTNAGQFGKFSEQGKVRRWRWRRARGGLTLGLAA